MLMRYIRIQYIYASVNISSTAGSNAHHLVQVATAMYTAKQKHFAQFVDTTAESCIDSTKDNAFQRHS